jgi:CBS domain containing-hemolysin-like protein
MDATRDEHGEDLIDEALASTDEELERRISRGVVNLESMAVREIMVPRPDIVGIETGKELPDAVELVNSAGFSRLPLFHETLDDVRGVLYAKDLLAAMHREPENGHDLEALARPAYMIPETKRLGNLLRDFQERRVHIALVVDEYGSLVGLITNEDVLEELVGEIDDEFIASEQLIERRGSDEAIVDARVPLKSVSEMFDVELEVEGFDTLGGLILDKLGRIPTAGETVTEGGITLKVLSTAGRRIRRVQVTRAQASDKESADPERQHIA